MSTDRLSKLAKGTVACVRPRASENERDFPHIVEIALPPDGFDAALSREMETFHRSRDIRPHFGWPKKRKGQHYCRWCFSDPAIADEFREQFGGVRLIAKQPVTARKSGERA